MATTWLSRRMRPIGALPALALTAAMIPLAPIANATWCTPAFPVAPANAKCVNYSSTNNFDGGYCWLNQPAYTTDGRAMPSSCAYYYNAPPDEGRPPLPQIAPPAATPTRPGTDSGPPSGGGLGSGASTRYAFPAAYSAGSPAHERPVVLDFAYRFHALTNLSWSSWGLDGAQGTGIETVQTSCTPSCSDGTNFSNPVQIRASNPQPPPAKSNCPSDVLFYTDIVITYPNSVPPRDLGLAADGISDLEWTTDNGRTAAHYSARTPFCGS